MLARLAGGTTPAHVASCYPEMIDALVVDEVDGDGLAADGPRAVVAHTLMKDAEAARRLAAAVLDAAGAPA